MNHVTLQDIIRQYVHLPNRRNHQGWYSVLCKVCNDHGRKGPRAAFRFDGEAVGYHCFNCNHAALFDPEAHAEIPQKMVAVLKGFGIPETDWQVINMQLLGKEINHKKQSQILNIEPGVITLPPYFYPVIDNNDEWNQVAIEYLADRKVSFKDYQFYVGKKGEHPDSKRWHGRLIIPIYKDRKLVFYQGRDMSDTQEQKYLSPGVSKASVLYGYENIFENTSAPLYITEGWFDAYHIKGAAIFGRKISPIQQAWFRQTSRTKVVVPDKSGDGRDLAMQALGLGWSVSLPDIGSCTDVNAAIRRYGQLYVQKTIHDNTYTGLEAEVMLGIYCTK